MKQLTYVLFSLFILFSFSCEEDGMINPPNPPNPDPVEVSIADVSIQEGNDYMLLDIAVTLNEAATTPVNVNFSTTDGTAERGKDFLAIDAIPVVFAPGESSKNYKVVIAGDYIFEADEHFEVNISNVSNNATIVDGTARVDLLNDDVDGPVNVPINLSIDWAALINLPIFAEAPFDIMNFGQPSNVNNADFTSVASRLDTIVFKQKMSPGGDSILYYGIDFEPTFEPSEYLEYIGFSLTPEDSVSLDIKLAIFNEDIEDVEFKYDLLFMVGTAEFGRFGPFKIDPKIRIPSQQ